ncbi:MAG: cytochrome c biogenesis protein CcsA, partial [Candidatus Poseidoniia archaeon]|nr:cytochrome c biogenesis protein CcsA [Candidatus Poseidoniia archaeon]
VMLIYFFYTTNLEYKYVSDYSSTNLSLFYKLSGLWAGRDGTLLIWTWSATLFMLLERKYNANNDKQKELTTAICTLIILALTIIQLYINPFRINEIVPDEGNGLNPLLLSPYMIIHPPIVFISYGMIVLLYAAGMAYLITGEKNWNESIKRWGRASWIGMSLALILGGYWAYVTLGWGGYWAWDPVETAGLLPWLSMTTLLHTSVMSRRKKTYVVLGPLLAMLTFILVLLESFVTRGGIWSSVHSFIVEETGGTFSRFWFVLENDISVRGFFIMMILAIATTLYLIIQKYKEQEIKEGKNFDSIEEIFNEENTFFAAIYTQLLILTVTLVLLLVRSKGYMAPEVFEIRLAPFMVLLAAIFTIHTLRPFFEMKNILVITGLGIIFSLIYALISEGRGWMVGAMAPWAVICGYSITKYMIHHKSKKLLGMLRAWGPYTAHLGFMLIIVGYCFSYGLGTENRVTLEEGERKIVGNYIIELEEIEMNPGDNEIELVAFITLELKDNKKIVLEDKISKKIQSGTNQDTTQIYLKHELDRDLYITLNSAKPGDENENSSAVITIRDIPGIILVWIG